MSKYTLRGSDGLEARIDADMARIAEAAAPHCMAGVLIGGYGRGEGTPFIHADGSQAPFNDYDLVVIVPTVNKGVRQIFQSLEKQLTAELCLPVDLCPYALSHLRRCEHSLLNHEMKYGHKVIWGDEHILDAMPDYPPDAIPLSEGTRLLLNRGKLLLDIRQRLLNPEPFNPEERIRYIKFMMKALLAMGDCALLAAGRYDISYSAKKKEIKRIGAFPAGDYIVAGYLKAVEMKEWGDFAPWERFDIAAEFKTVRDVYLEFMPWYRERTSTKECGLLKAALLNLRWNGRPLLRHPRIYLYDAILELLKDEPDEFRLQQALFSNDNLVERFYLLQRRFS